MITADATNWHRQGYLVCRGLFSGAEATHYRRLLDAQRGPAPNGARSKWNRAGGVACCPDFWSLLLDDRIPHVLRQAFGTKRVVYTGQSDQKVWERQPSTGWHRDSISQRFGDGPEWDEGREPYQVARAALYLQGPEERFRWGGIPGSHRWERIMGRCGRLFWGALLRPLDSVGSRLGYLPTERGRLWIRTGGPLAPPAEPVWLSPEPGDCLLFDPRLIHAGGDVPGRKYAVFFSFGADNGHSRRHADHFRDRATGPEGKTALTDLDRRLAEKGLLLSA